MPINKLDLKGAEVGSRGCPLIEKEVGLRKSLFLFTNVLQLEKCNTDLSGVYILSGRQLERKSKDTVMSLESL